MRPETPLFNLIQMKDLIIDIERSLREFEDSKRKEFALKSHPTKMQVTGVSVPNLKIVLKELKKRTKDFSTIDKIKLTKDLINTDIFECQQLL